MASDDIKSVRAMLANLQAGEPPSLAELRARYDGLSNVFPVPAGVTVEKTVLDGTVPGEVLTLASGGAGRTVLYLHGGGYAIGSSASHRHLAGAIADAAGATVLVPDYRMGPEHPFPAAVEDAVAAYRGLLADGKSPANIVIAGDSAGGGLTLATMMAAREQGLPMPAAGVLISPWVDLAGTGGTMESLADRDPMVSKAGLAEFAAHYLGEGDRKAPLASPLYGDLTGLPPLLIQVGTDEVLLDDARRIDRLARDHGVTTQYEEWDEMIHVWHFFYPMLREGRDAIGKLGEFIQGATG
jgi:monoterpene epsilon-lactone hydrolase